VIAAVTEVADELALFGLEYWDTGTTIEDAGGEAGAIRERLVPTADEDGLEAEAFYLIHDIREELTGLHD
tara:strand:+ start:830 stop:1039 length:210 start_codon:yes stop_codon:yes gene_type:complete